MKKASLRERKEAFKKAYYEELQNKGVMDKPKETKKPKSNKKEKVIEAVEETVEETTVEVTE